ncbi:protein GFS12 [Impatiens glandulifera]|uniref:protein GFS12 n=1 Tax=Impatiens glandulifera TaxID=253017 RepID=UPI001FB0BAAD|nr:protein GFS12 [Impatiens glandulifera]
MHQQMCSGCLERRIHFDFSQKLIFSYGISSSVHPFSSTAVVQMVYADGEASPQFLLTCVLNSTDYCLRKYIEELYEEGRETKVAGVISSAHNEVTLADLGCGDPKCRFSCKFSCYRTITSLAPIAQVGISSDSTFEDIVLNLVSGFPEDNILNSLTTLIEGKASPRESVNFLHLLGIPSFRENDFPGCLRHPNLAPILGMVKASEYTGILLPMTPFTLENILHFSPGVFKSEWHIQFLIYQLLSALAHIHGLGVSHSNLCPSNVFLTDFCWSWIHVMDGSQLDSCQSSSCSEVSNVTGCCMEDCVSQGVFTDIRFSQTLDWHSAFQSWWRGDLSNFDYLLVLNRLAGRRWGDHSFHPVMPWVIDFSTKPDEKNDAGWRDLRRSKWRLAKGDEQLDFTYSSSEIPHHVSDECLSELAVCSYKARRLPLRILRMAVRSVYEPNEYPSSMQRLYQWTPDECIPEFYSDPQIFISLHSGMNDLVVPSWADSPHEFIRLHREALESNHVSREINHWIDITFGYKMSGEAAIAAKNVMLPFSDTTVPRSMGRRQLFSQPHPPRRASFMETNVNSNSSMRQSQLNGVDCQNVLLETSHLLELEETAAFCEHALHLSPLYYDEIGNSVSDDHCVVEAQKEAMYKATVFVKSSVPDINSILENIDVEDCGTVGYQDLLLWSEKLLNCNVSSKGAGRDIFSIGCILAELYLKRPLFNSISLSVYHQTGVLPSSIGELPPHAQVLVEACIQKDWRRRPSAKCLLESPYFTKVVKSCFLFLAPLQLLAKDGSCLCYAASFAKQGALKAMGTFAAEKCASYCLSFTVVPLSDAEAEYAYVLLKEFLKCLKEDAVKTIVVPAIQKILQATGYSHLKFSLLQDSFMREIWNCIGKQAYLECIHPLVISNLWVSPDKSSAAAASVLLICSSEELGIPVTVQQTILPLIQCFGRGISSDGIDVLLRIGGLLGETFIVTQILPLLRNVIHSCIDVSCLNKPEPLQSWSSSAFVDCVMTLDGLLTFLSKEVIVQEFIEHGTFLHLMALMQTNFGIQVLQVAATSLVAICERVGPDLTALHVLPRLKGLFDELAFSQEITSASDSSGRSIRGSMQKVDVEKITSRIDLVLLLYPSFASLLGIEKLRQCCTTWLLLEQFLLRNYNWKWEYTRESLRSSPENLNTKRSVSMKKTPSDYAPAKMLLNGVGWSVPQSQGQKGTKNLMPPSKRTNEPFQDLVEQHASFSTSGKEEPWHWFPSLATNWDAPDFVGRLGGPKDELPWKIRASIIHSIRAHHGVVRSVAVCADECTVFTGGVGQGFRGTVLKWDLSRMGCTIGYYGHEEVVNDMCVLPYWERIASCDGTIHIWNSQTGKVILILAESSSALSLHSSGDGVQNSASTNVSSEQANVLNSSSSSSVTTNGIFSSVFAFDERLYTCMHYLKSMERLVVGTGNGSIRFIDVPQGQKLHLWRSESGESSFPSLISCLSSCGSDKMQGKEGGQPPSWIAAGLSSGNCKLLDTRSGNIIASWRAHEGYLTKLASPEEHLLVSSSLDKTLRVWDLRRSWMKPEASVVFKGHNDGITGFSMWGQDVISIAKNKIGLSSLSRPADEDGQQQIRPQYLYLAERGTRNMSVLSSSSIMPFSRLFLVGTEDGYLKICC